MSILAFQMFSRAPSLLAFPKCPTPPFRFTRASRNLPMPGHRNDTHMNRLPVDIVFTLAAVDPRCAANHPQ